MRLSLESATIFTRTSSDVHIPFPVLLATPKPSAVRHW